MGISCQPENEPIKETALLYGAKSLNLIVFAIGFLAWVKVMLLRKQSYLKPRLKAKDFWGGI
jgi:hypothetical protein